jgi:excinuclease UvrABC nuclease subunit
MFDPYRRSSVRTPPNEVKRGLHIKDGRVQKFTKDNIAKVPNVKGGYVFFNANKQKIYTGRASGSIGAKWGKDEEDRWVYGLRHRLQSYYQKDDYGAHPTKQPLRNNIVYFDYTVFRNEGDLRKWEKTSKQGNRFNFL